MPIAGFRSTDTHTGYRLKCRFKTNDDSDTFRIRNMSGFFKSTVVLSLFTSYIKLIYASNSKEKGISMLQQIPIWRLLVDCSFGDFQYSIADRSLKRYVCERRDLFQRERERERGRSQKESESGILRRDRSTAAGNAHLRDFITLCYDEQCLTDE